MQPVLHQPALGVSILTRPEGRVLLVQNVVQRGENEFQSSPGPKAECYAGRHAPYAASSASFQSSPGPKAGC
ncbi:MAG: hypothetical protein M3Q65_03785, partial [Chloroflexota bacterium]|nr:hypothetical protein [Chloroflexota bacterium]